ncbi:MAG: metal ABC transporter solute-binding protein, Zn/Mn family, partial [Spirochaetota bacterium]
FFLTPQAPLWASGSAEQQTNASEQENGLLIYVSILPQQYFVEQIAGPHAEVRVMVPPGRSPASYEPSPKQVARLGRADLFFTIGVPFENAFVPLIRDEIEHLRIIDTSKGIEKRSIHADEIVESGAEADGDHEDGHDHEGEQPDPHIWLAPPLVIEQAAHIRDGLIQAEPEKEQLYRENYRRFRRELQELHAELKEILQPVKGSTILVYHPSFGYFAETYGLSQIAIEMGGKEPGARQLQEVIKTAKANNAKVIFVQPEFSKASARKVADAIDGAVVEVAPLKLQYMQNMRSIASAIRSGLSQ